MSTKPSKPCLMCWAIILAFIWVLLPFFVPRCFKPSQPKNVMYIKAMLLLLLCASSVTAAENVQFIKVPSRPPPPAQACPTNIIISGIVGPPAQYAFVYGANCPYTNNGVNYRVGTCSLSSSCTNLSANSIIVSNAAVGSIVGIVTVQCRNGQIYPTNLVLGSGFSGAQFYWGINCDVGCTTCTPFVCRVNDTSPPQ